MTCLLDIAFFAAGISLFAVAVCQQAQLYRDNRVAVRCACGRSVKRLSMVSNADIIYYAQLLTNECPRCHERRMKAKG